MIINDNHTAPQVNIDHIVKLVESLYHSKDPAEQSEADSKLTELQASDAAWQICWSLLDTHKYTAIEVHFFAANLLVRRINQSWTSQSDEWLEKELRPKLLETLLNYASAPDSDKLVVDRLSLALATFALHSIPTFWPDAIENIIHSFTTQTLPVNLTSQRICDIVLKILLYIPEEYAILTPHQEHRAQLNGQISKAGPVVFSFLHSLLKADKSAMNPETKRNVLKCLTSWTLHSRTTLLELEDGRSLLDSIYELIWDEELCDSACASLAASFSNQRAENFRNAIIDFIPKIAGLQPVIEKYKYEEEIECVIKIYSLVINFSENHSRLFLKLILKEGIELPVDRAETIKQSIFTIIRIILDCTSASGTYGVDEKYSDISFAFWFTFFENFCYYTDSMSDLICETFDPLVDSILQILITKSQYPPASTYYQDWNDDQRESYRCYRQDLGDNISLVVQFPRAKERILACLHDQLVQELAQMFTGEPIHNEKPWQGLESVIFALKSISETVAYDEAKYVPKIFNLVSQVTFDESHALLYCTIAEMISAYSDWLYSHKDQLAIALNILFLGVTSANPHVRLLSTLSLKDLTQECQYVLRPFINQIIKPCTEAIRQTKFLLSTNEKSRLMHTLGTTLAVAPADTVMETLSTVTVPIMFELSKNSQSDPTTDPLCRPVIYDRLKMLNSLIESLYVQQYDGNQYETDGDENEVRHFDPARYDVVSEGDIVQPALSLLKQLMPIMDVIAAKYKGDEEIMEIVNSTIKRSAKSLGIEMRPVVCDIMTMIINAYDPLLNSNILEGSVPLYLLFKSDSSLGSVFRDAFARLSDKTLQVCIDHPLRQLSVTVENYFRFTVQVFKKYPNFLLDQITPINIEYIYKLAIASLELPERRTLAEVCAFLCLYRQKSIGVTHLHDIFARNLNEMLVNLFNIMGGNYSTPRNAIDHVTDLLYMIVDAQEIKMPLQEIVLRHNFPTSFVNQEQKSRFVSRLTHERNRRKFKDMCNDFVLVLRNLNRQ